jgi:hypothetical protein
MQSELKKRTTTHEHLHFEYILLFIWALHCSGSGLLTVGHRFSR